MDGDIGFDVAAEGETLEKNSCEVEQMPGPDNNSPSSGVIYASTANTAKKSKKSAVDISDLVNDIHTTLRDSMSPAPDNNTQFHSTDYDFGYDNPMLEVDDEKAQNYVSSLAPNHSAGSVSQVMFVLQVQKARKLILWHL